MSRNFDDKGFTLVELMMALAIVGVIAAFTIGIAASVRNMGKIGETERRMKIIAESTVSFYSGKQEIPRPINASTGNPVTISTASLPYTVSGNVPIEPAALNLEQKYRLDGWGQYFTYIMALYGTVTINGVNIPPSGAGYHTDANTDIDGVSYNGDRVAGVIISYGPNLVADYTVSGSSDPTTITPNTGSDDIIMPINVEGVAKDIVAKELSILQSKAEAFDSMYTGIDNNANISVDEGGDISDNATCPPLNPAGDVVNDPLGGMTTLDGIYAGDYDSCLYGCESPTPADWRAINNDADPTTDTPPTNDKVNARIYCLYKLPVTIMVDPWLVAYAWGSEDDLVRKNEDDRYHKFYSWGPDRDTDYDSQDVNATEDDDDIIP